MRGLVIECGVWVSTTSAVLVALVPLVASAQSGAPSQRLFSSVGDSLPRSGGATRPASVPGETESEPGLMDDRAVSPANIHFEPGSGLHITSDDGLFGISIGARGQGRYTVEHEDGGDAEHELTVRRARIKIGGHALAARPTATTCSATS